MRNEPRLPRLTPGELDADQSALYDEIAGGPRAQGPQYFALTDDDGSLNGPFNAFLFAPRVGRALQALGAAIRYQTGLSDRERELAILIVAAHWGSSFERRSHEAVGRGAGLSEAEMAAVRAGSIPALEDERERAVVELTRALTLGDVAYDAWQATRAALDEATVVELTTLVGYYATLALQLRVFRVDERQQ